MTRLSLYHDGSRRMQDRFATRALADRLAEKLARAELSDEDRAFIESRPFFFLATADAQGRPDCSYKGGTPGFVRVLDAQTLAFPSYDGNGMFRSAGNIAVNPSVGLLFMDFESPKRLRVSGQASIDEDDRLLETFVGSQLVVRVRTEAIFPNCPRYVHKMQVVEESVYVPREQYTPPVPNWKRRPEFREVLPPGDPARFESDGTGRPSETFLYLTTRGRVSGLPRTIEIWFVELAGCYYAVAERGEEAQWVKNLQRDPAVRFRIGTRAEAGAEKPGTARIVREEQLVPAVASRMRDKYGWSDGLVVEIRPGA
jgi:predicted pyridoxine 5'-phosphate oxidase superfamily flavin-nucleotide-binding protein